MKTIINFAKEPCFFEVTDEEFAEWERRNAKQIEKRRIMASHDEAQAIRNAERRRDEHWRGVAAENEQLRLQLAELEARLDKK